MSLKSSIIGLDRLRRQIGHHDLLRALHHDFSYKTGIKRASKILIIAPHPDDDVIGMGGTMALYQRARTKIKVIYLFNGVGGTKDGRKNQALAQQRRKEAETALNNLGIIRMDFYGWEDGSSIVNHANIMRLREEIKSFTPDYVFIPSPADDHEDHRAANRLLAKAILPYRARLEIALYEVWTPMYFNRLIMIDDEAVSRKAKAIRAHQSQLAARQYDKAALALNHFRGLVYGVGEYAEAFWLASKKQYIELARKI